MGQEEAVLHSGRLGNATHAKALGMRMRSLFTFLRLKFRGQVVYSDFHPGLASEQPCATVVVAPNAASAFAVGARLTTMVMHTIRQISTRAIRDRSGRSPRATVGPLHDAERACARI